MPKEEQNNSTMNLTKHLPIIVQHIEIGKRTFNAILVCCLTILLICIINRDYLFINNPANCTLTTKTTLSPKAVMNNKKAERAINVKPTAAPSIENATSKGSSKIYNLSALLAPDALRKRGVSEAIILQKQQQCRDYVKRFAKVAQVESEKYGIPASIKLAQALLESDAGDSRLARSNNNHFGIKCFSRKCAKGHCSNFTDDTHKDFFKKYGSAWLSFRDHSLFLQRKRYRHLKKIPVTDYEGWARGLKEAGYATDRSYSEKLTAIVRTLNLDDYD